MEANEIISFAEQIALELGCSSIDEAIEKIKIKKTLDTQ